MFDDTITKNMGNPASYNAGTNKLTWTSNNKSNVSSLGNKDSNTGLNAFNGTIKKSLKYLYLNNNKFFNLDALSGFSNIEELQCMCNANLSNIDGLAGHSTIKYLTLQSCNLTFVGSYDASTKKYSGGLTGCSGLTTISMQNNKNLNSLCGLESANDLYFLIANRCSITDISALTNKSKVYYLDLANNVNLVKVKYLQYCKALTYLYLDNNTNMSSTELDAGLNGIDASIGTSVLISNLFNGYNNIPESYWSLFYSDVGELDFSYSKLGKYLTNDSSEWIKIRENKNLKKLKLDGQTSLTMDDTTKIVNGTTVTYYGITSTLKTLTGMIALSLNDMTQLNDISFVNPVYETKRR
jgi:hypothetical protein